MSTVVVVTPIIIANWPVIVSAVSAAMATMGYAVVPEPIGISQTADTKNRAEIEVEDSEILENATATGEQIVVERDGIRAVFSRDARGALKVCVEGHGHSKGELRAIGEELIGRVTQQYVYHRVMTGLQDRNLAVVEESVDENRTVRIRVRNWA